MPREEFDRGLQLLEDDLLNLSSMVEKSILRSIDALKNRDLKLAEEIIFQDNYIDEKTTQIEEKCIHLIATQQPIATDLRKIVVFLLISNELERIGDYAEGIAKISIAMGNEPPLKPLIDIPIMAEKTSSMLKNSIDSLVNRDIVTATSIMSADDEIDDLYKKVYKDLLRFMLEDSKTIQRATYLLWVAHDLERTADRATNIAERVIYLVTGKSDEYSESNSNNID
ncbi:MAG: phosphate transport system regulatory protein PhoU [Chloroflexi bacterium]|jgi:phosphate transport system protein|nr:phosphate transport system regulatory protein PhoU [Chloroflexota bacterium]MCH2305037.1 phosphate signaling complex protein PhoU [SAR202 cluster bacterium]|tara:strand:- start:55489 stop:56166 length:678 start_codon:yes stop_codon:yes gene_type:complete